MKKFLFVFTALTAFILNSAFGDPVDSETALQVARNFCLTGTVVKNASSADLALTFTATSISLDGQTPGRDGEFPVFYVFNLAQNGGFVIVSADDDVTPVLGYSTNGNFDKSNLPPPFRKLLELYKDQIRYTVIGQLKADNEIRISWENLENGRPMNSSKSVKTVSPLLTTTWNQFPYENEMCPADAAGPGGHCVTGCPATAMGQIMKFWNYPPAGTGFHSYNASNSNGNYGTLSADFGNTTYNWASMPDHLSYSNDAVALLMLHCGVAVEMSYGPNGSGGWVIENDQNGNHPYCSEVAYKTYFGYQSSLQGVMRQSYNDAQWKQMLKTDLDAGRPIQYAGWGSGGHTFVCDGYDQNDYFDMNWGWGGSYNGFYDLDALNPGTEYFNSNQQAVIGIQPAGGSTNTTLQIYAAITVTPDPITFGAGFTVHTDIANMGTTTFQGDYTAALFTSDGTFIDYVQIMSDATLEAGYHYTSGLDFVTTGINAATPGDYIIGIYSRPTGGGWTMIAAGSYTNPIDVSVAGSTNDIGLYSNIVVDHNPIMVGQPFTATTDIANYGSTDFDGDISLDLHASDGTWIQTIEEYDGNHLQAGYYFNDVTFSSTGLSVAPGNYFLVAWDRPTGGSWELVGASTYSNPITVVIAGEPLSTDSYEPNNTEATAHQLSVNFSGDNATVNTNGSNINSSTDIDYYKFDLPAGYYYFIRARVDDSYNSGNGQTYTADVMFNFKSGGKWSDSYDTDMPSDFMMQGGTMVFNVFPYFPGVSGTYLLEINILRSLTGIEVNPETNTVRAFPNPANDLVTFSFDLKNTEILSGSLMNIYGQKVQDIPEGTFGTGQSSIKADVSALPAGYYLYQFDSSKGKITGKFVIAR